MAKTPWEMAAVGNEFSDQSALFAWAAMAQSFGVTAANSPKSYTLPGFAKFTLDNLPARFDDRLFQLKWLHAIKNQGHGDRIRGARSKAEGVRPGVFDVFLPVVCLKYHARPFEGGQLTHTHPDRWLYCGLYLELKRIKDGKPSDIQLEFQADMRAAGYAAEIAYGWEAACDTLLRYLGHA